MTEQHGTDAGASPEMLESSNRLPTESAETRVPGHERPASVRTVAVIDIGTTSIRMAVAEIDAAGHVRPLEALSQAVNLGGDTFTTGRIGRDTVEQCVRILRSYRQVLAEYQIERPERIRVVATSAVREAENRLQFLDRIYSATGFEVEPIDDAEVNRVTYLGIQPLLDAEPALAKVRALITEVGGGSTDLLVMRGRDVISAHSYRLGSLRLRETLQAYRAPRVKLRDIMQAQIRRTIEQVRQHVPGDERTEIVALGGDVRFAAAQLVPDWDGQGLGRLPVPALARFTDRILKMSEDDLVRRYHLPFPEAETLGPALLAYVELARAFRRRQLLVTTFNLRDALLQEMALPDPWTEQFRAQIIRAALRLGRRYHFDEAHATHVSALAQRLFRELSQEHRMPPRYELLLAVAALLHDIGLYVGFGSHHKHSMYLIVNSELFGLTKKDLHLVGLVARYHRRSPPKPSHEEYAGLDRASRVAVSQMAALLRVAKALDESHSQRIQEIRCTVEPGRLFIDIPHVDDLSLEQLALEQNAHFFLDVFGLSVMLRTARH